MRRGRFSSLSDESQVPPSVLEYAEQSERAALTLEVAQFIDQFPTTPQAGETIIARVLICDDNLLFRDALGTILSYQNNTEVVGLCSSAAEALQLAGELQPDIVMLDWHLTGVVTGRDACELIRGMDSNLYLVIITGDETTDVLYEAMECGANAVVHKAELLDQLTSDMKVKKASGARAS